MKARVIIFFVLVGFSLWGMEMVKKPSKKQANKNWFIEALNYRRTSKDPIVLCFQDVGDKISEVARNETVDKSIQAMLKEADVVHKEIAVNEMLTPLSQLSGRVSNNKVKKIQVDEKDNGWIGFVTGVSCNGLFFMQKYNLSSNKCISDSEIDKGLSRGEYNYLEKSNMVVVNVPYSREDDLGLCFTLIRSLYAKSIPLLVHSDRRLLQDMWENLGDLFPEKEDAKVFSNYQLSDDYSDDAAETSSGQQSKSEDIFAYDGDDSNDARDDSNNAEEDIFGY